MTIQQFKQDDPSNILLITDPLYVQAILTWKKLNVSLKGDAFESLEDCWDHCVFDLAQWSRLLNRRLFEMRRIFSFLKSNNLIYPDGTVPASIDTYIRSRLITELSKFTSKQKKPVNNPASTS
jgi:hypothetical protein